MEKKIQILERREKARLLEYVKVDEERIVGDSEIFRDVPLFHKEYMKFKPNGVHYDLLEV